MGIFYFIFIFLKTQIPRWEKNRKVIKTLHKTSQKEDWDQPQP